ncbi:hypothetical protein AtNW77_Chr5g0150931 [Arabidopsis thaliana]|uniref:Neuronal PAS domain protein n=3 Tax=Arabidopsis TaxID=3701 RepID=A0A178U864_ARATH|nr:hypothetical protein ISN45_At05g060400 [Arabidopsis thaliana x Arabidopsis arenosa]KAG7614134.1 hypothetical protein ISN44_As05g059640 [Arabidopsis suecica]OAO90016.1 hypothetical protein AXX17_AT5G63790 [Arabidopsis thaliana]
MMSEKFPDVFTWIQSIPQITKWRTTSLPFCICPSTSDFPNSTLNLTAQKSPSPKVVTFSIIVQSNNHSPLYLWTTKQELSINPNSPNPFDELTIISLLFNFVETILTYTSNSSNYSTIKIPNPDSSKIGGLKDIVNTVILTLSFVVCVYEAPLYLRENCLNTLKNHLITCHTRRATISLMKLLGSNLEEQWMRTVNLAFTNWIIEQRRSQSTKITTTPLFSYAVSAYGLWKVQLYCPVEAMEVERSSNPTADSRLLFSLKFNQLEGVMQFNHKVVVRDNWIDVIVKIDNIRYDVIKLVNEKLMSRRGAGEHEKHFPSRISLQLTPTLQTDFISVSVSKSSNNPGREFEVERSIEGSFDPPNSLGLRVAGREASTMTMTPWKLEQSVLGYTANLNWILYDSSVGGREVFSTKPSRFSIMSPRSWFKDRYARAYRSFTRRGGVIFAGDEYGESVVWKIGKGALGGTMEWEIKGFIWLTYWPNKYKTFYHETRRLEFTQLLNLTIA